MKVIITDCWYENIDEETRILTAAGHELQKFDCKNEEELIRATADADAVITQFAAINENVINHMKNCKLIVRYAIGVDNIDVSAATRRGIFVANVPDYCVDEVSNHAIALLFSLIRKIPQITKTVKEGQWDYTLVKPVSRMVGKKLGIIGFGRIGKLVARKMSGFGVDVLTVDPFSNSDAARLSGTYLVGIDDLLSQSDYITVHTPLNEKTYHYIDQEKFSKMKDGVIFINTSRGRVVDEAALIRALETGKVSAAGLDVLEQEPIAMDNPLLQMDNVLITPHFAWYSKESIVLLQQSVANEAVRVLNGDIPKNLVNREVLIRSTRR